MDIDRAHSIALRAVHEHYALQKVHELTFILCLIEHTDIVVEIGCDAGGTSWAIQEWGVRRHIGIDLPGDRFSSGLAWTGNGEMIWGNSHSKDTKETLVDMLTGESIGTLIIDGDHTYAGVADDFRMYGKLSSGLVMFHDICKHQDKSVRVRQFFREIKGRFPHTEFVAPYDETWGGVGVLDTSYCGRLKGAIYQAQEQGRKDLLHAQGEEVHT